MPIGRTNVVEYIIRMRDGYSGQLSKANAGTRRLRNNVRKLTGSTALFGTTLRTALGPLALIFSAGAIIRGVGSLTVNLQEAEVAMGSLFRLDKEGSKNLLDNLRLHAETVPITTAEYLKYSKMLASVGVAQGQLIPILDIMGDVGLAVGREKLPFIVKALRDVIAAGRLYGQEVRQFRDNAIDIVGELAAMYGLTREQAKKLQEQQAFTAQDVVKALNRMTSAGGRFFEFMKKMGDESISGKFAILVGKLQNMTFELANAATPNILLFLDTMTEFVDKMRGGGFAQGMDAFAGALSLLKTILADPVIKDLSGIASLLGGEQGELGFFSSLAIYFEGIKHFIIKVRHSLSDMFSESIAGVKRLAIVSNPFLSGKAKGMRLKKLAEGLDTTERDNLEIIRHGKRVRDIQLLAASTRDIAGIPDALDVSLLPGKDDPLAAGAAGANGRGVGGIASASARDIIINIDQLKVADTLSFKTLTFKESKEIMMANLRDMLLTVVNDVNFAVR